MRNIQIPRIVLHHQKPFLHYGNHYDLLGCILLELGFDSPDKSKFPSEMKIEIKHFTRTIRRKVVDTQLTYQILSLDAFPLKEAIVKLNSLVNPIGLNISLVD